MDNEVKVMDPAVFERKFNEMLWENRIQTIAVILVFLWGVNTLSDLVKKLKD